MGTTLELLRTAVSYEITALTWLSLFLSVYFVKAAPAVLGRREV